MGNAAGISFGEQNRAPWNSSSEGFEGGNRKGGQAMNRKKEARCNACHRVFKRSKLRLLFDTDEDSRRDKLICGTCCKKDERYFLVSDCYKWPCSGHSHDESRYHCIFIEQEGKA